MDATGRSAYIEPSQPADRGAPWITRARPTPAPVTPEAFLADRERFLDGVWTAITWALGIAVVTLVLMAIFLV